MIVSHHQSIADIPAGQWDALNRDNNPFLRHAFLLALERHGAVGGHSGWLPRPVTLYRDRQLIGAVPLYEKWHSLGEFVFDHAWADALNRRGLDYYPKLVAASPYSPVTGPRMLIAPDLTQTDEQAAASALVDACLDQAHQHHASSLHWLFVDEAQQSLLAKHRHLSRIGCQFHWHNRHFSDYENFLARMSSRHRKRLRRERRRINEQGLDILTLNGADVSQRQWHFLHRAYLSTFAKKGNFAMFGEGFFAELGKTMPEQLVLVIAEEHGEPVAASLFFRNATTLYGRYWGCIRDYDSLHFELCYHRGIEYCIDQGLTRFEAGAQGEHKLARGFEPVITRSSHWIVETSFSIAIDDFLQRERPLILDYCHAMRSQLPFRVDADECRDNGKGVESRHAGTDTTSAGLG